MRVRLTFILSFVLIVSACKSDKERDKEIREQLNSNWPTSIIYGAYEAGMTANKKYIPLLLHDAANPSASTSLKFYGITVYTEKMHALEQILQIKPPHPYMGNVVMPDSVNIRFYNALWQKINESK